MENEYSPDEFGITVVELGNWVEGIEKEVWEERTREEKLKLGRLQHGDRGFKRCEVEGRRCEEGQRRGSRVYEDKGDLERKDSLIMLGSHRESTDFGEVG